MSTRVTVLDGHGEQRVIELQNAQIVALLKKLEKNDDAQRRLLAVNTEAIMRRCTAASRSLRNAGRI
jgi:hypothetical protein